MKSFVNPAKGVEKKNFVFGGLLINQFYVVLCEEANWTTVAGLCASKVVQLRPIILFKSFYGSKL